jgi:hypothetical protein
MYELILLEIIAVRTEPRRGRRNPRVVKRKISNFPTKCRAPSRTAGQPVLHYADHIRVVAPPEPPPKPAPRGHLPQSLPQETWKSHVRAWRKSGQSRAAYCLAHRIDEKSFNRWIARLRHTFQKPRVTTKAAALVN